MKKILSILTIAFSIKAAIFTPEHYQKQVDILRNLDIDPSYMSDLIFLEDKNLLENTHGGNLQALKSFDFAPSIRKMISQKEMPEEILYLAIVESGLKIHSTSSAKAVGIWQLMKPTAKSFGLRIDPYVDERRDPFKSTQAALEYLKQLKQEFGKWYLAILAYNCGHGKLRQAINEAGSDDLFVLVDPEKRYLPLETRMFIKKIITLAFLANNSDYLLSNNAALFNYALFNNFVEIKVPSAVALKEISDMIELDLKTFKRYNPQFKYDFTPPDKESYVYIPIDKLALFKEKFDPKKMTKVDTTIPKTKIYIVKSGDSLYKIAKKHKISVATIKEYNELKGSHLSINQKLVLPIMKEKNNDNYQAKNKNKDTHIVSR
ncbi:lytic transglycosylase domain-containing protein [Campylobacter sp. US33a]|uniref:Transglycosylase SLT domain-containing protein n=1 Tax=Campylobacter sp. CCS1377 TaxID=3158229 RepID=A0AAU7E4W1_9BACT|nr:lytic transglycosylase domain-containing protein [Campylobacter sp. US33a]MCW1360863.1 transglycosylase SLT domain-containing protein [Campylobacter jejuni]TEY01175.1 LysM peptidoglycan-binding domain-containing protein [Campylobacter sp. US33a]